MSRDYHKIIFQDNLDDALTDVTRLATMHLESDAKLPGELAAYYRGWLDCVSQLYHVLEVLRLIHTVKKDGFEIVEDE